MIAAMTRETRLSVAVIGAGIAGSACAQALLRAGHTVQVFDKSRGPGGRLATRRTESIDRQGRACTTRFDHGAVAVSASTVAFRTFLDQAVHAGWLAEWTPRLAEGSVPLEVNERLCVAVPDMPELCRRLLDGAAATWTVAVDRLHRGPLGWQVEAGGQRFDTRYDALVLALPPAQAAPLLSPHRRDWARHAAVATMQPCWTLMGAAQAPSQPLDWDLARPATGPLAWVMRNDARPGREHVAGQAHWVAHARPAWSRRHLEQPTLWVQQQMQAALVDCLGQSIDWHHSAVHRWRYATPAKQSVATTGLCWWDGNQGLGVCGDFLGGSGAEGAWLSGKSLSLALAQSAAGAAGAADAASASMLPPAARERAQCLVP